MNLSDLEIQIEGAYASLADARARVFVANNDLISVSNEVDKKRNSLMESVDGKTKEIRAAKIDEIISEDLKFLIECEAADRDARLQFDLAQISVDLARARLRLAELGHYEADNH